MSHPLRRVAATLAIAVASLVPVITGTSAGAATSPSIVSSILAHTDNYLTSVRTYFLCTTAKCKKERPTLLKSARSAMSGLSAQESTAAAAHIPSKYRASVDLFVTDMRNLRASFHEYFITASTVILSGLVGNIFYQTSDVGSDVNLLRAVSKNTPVSFKLWVEGEAATLVAMQTDAAALQSSTATKSIGIYANQLLEAESTAMAAHANGPDRSFNTLLKNFAHHQQRISQSEILFLQGKKAPMSETQVANLNVTVAAEFASLIKAETALVKKK
ncbi:MAG: hypothetical protein HIU57_02835 [Acidobacteria bacterium]|nr:hypothetical protein [Acidobacteriota bacterium]